MYHDPSCDGGVAAPGWKLDDSSPSTTRSLDLDDDGTCAAAGTCQCLLYGYFDQVYFDGYSCADLNADCPGWAATGQCDINPAYLLPNCAVSCNSCTTPPVGTYAHPQATPQMPNARLRPVAPLLKASGSPWHLPPFLLASSVTLFLCCFQTRVAVVVPELVVDGGDDHRCSAAALATAATAATTAATAATTAAG